MKKGISLIGIVITIIIMIILSGVVVIGLTDNNPITNAKKAVFQDAVAKYKEDFEMYKETNIGKDIEDCKGEDVKKYIESLNEKDIGKFSIENKNLIYTGESGNERKWSSEVDIQTSRNKAPVLIKSKKINNFGTGCNLAVSNLQYDNIYTYKLFDENINISKYNNVLKEVWKTEIPKQDNIPEIREYNGYTYMFFSSNLMTELYIVNSKGEIITREKMDFFIITKDIFVENNKIIIVGTSTDSPSNYNYITITLENNKVKSIDKKIKYIEEMTGNVQNFTYQIYNEEVIITSNIEKNTYITKLDRDGSIKWQKVLAGVLMPFEIGKDVLIRNNEINYITADGIGSHNYYLHTLNIVSGKEINKANIHTSKSFVNASVYKDTLLVVDYLEDKIKVIRKDKEYKNMWFLELPFGRENFDIVQFTFDERNNKIYVLRTKDDGSSKLEFEAFVYEFM